jgi:ABC-type glycerol-3-phosphate transport system substrate-binding protein
MKAVYRWGILCLLVAAGASIPVSAQAPEPQAEPAKEALRFGFSRFYRQRIPLEEFQQLNPTIVVEEVGWSRNLLKWFDPPVIEAVPLVPDVMLLTAGRYSEDVRYLAERKLIVPVDPWLAELGIKQADFLPATLDAFRYDGELMAVPHHAVVPMLRYDRSLFGGGAPPACGSWEELLAVAKPLLSSRGEPGPTAALSVPLTLGRFAEYLALGAGAEPLDLAKPDFLTSPLFQRALKFAMDSQSQRLLAFRPMHKPATPALRAVFVLDYVDSLYPDTAFGIMPAPMKLGKGDAEPKLSRIPGFVEGLALHGHAAAKREIMLAFLQWFVAPETEWQISELTNQRAPAQEWLLDNVHLPLRPGVFDSIDFEYAQRKYPELAVMRDQLSKAWFPVAVAPLDYRAWEIVEGTVDYLKKDSDLKLVLEKLRAKVAEMVRTTPVESVAYGDY